MADGSFVHRGSHDLGLNIWCDKTGHHLCMASRPEYAAEIEAALNAHRGAARPDADTTGQVEEAIRAWARDGGTIYDGRTLVDAVMVAVAPVLAERDNEITKLRKQVEILGNHLQRTAYTETDVANRDAEIERLNLEIQGYQCRDGYEKGHEHGSAAAASFAEQLRSVRAELRIEEDNAEFAERALHLVLGCCDPTTDEDCPGRVSKVYDAVRAGTPVPYSWAKLSAALVERTNEREQLRAERDELRTHGVYREIGEANEQMRAELDELRAKAVVLPDDTVDRISLAISDPGSVLSRGSVGDFGRESVPRWSARAVLTLLESWRPSTSDDSVCTECHCAGGIHKTWCTADLAKKLATPEQPDGEATPAEPRVWRKGDDPPPLDVNKVRHSNSQVFTRVGPDQWRAGIGRILTSEQLMQRLHGYTLTEVIEPPHAYQDSYKSVPSGICSVCGEPEWKLVHRKQSEVVEDQTGGGQ